MGLKTCRCPNAVESAKLRFVLMTDLSSSHPARVKAAGGHTNCQGGQLESRGREREVVYAGQDTLLSMLFCLIGRLNCWLGPILQIMNDQTIKYVTSCDGAGPSQKIKS